MAQLSYALSWDLANPKWASALNPILANNILQGNQINGITLVANTPLPFNHQLGRVQMGWFLTDQNAAANIFRTQPWNDKFLTLESSANVTINVWVY